MLRFVAMIVDLLAQQAMDRLNRRGAAGLSPLERTVAAVWLFSAGVANSGFAGYLSGPKGGLAADAPAALRTIGAVRLAELAEQANAVFPAGLPAERTQRAAAMSTLPASARQRLEELDHAYFACEEDADLLLERYVTAQRAQT